VPPETGKYRHRLAGALRLRFQGSNSNTQGVVRGGAPGRVEGCQGKRIPDIRVPHRPRRECAGIRVSVIKKSLPHRIAEQAAMLLHVRDHDDDGIGRAVVAPCVALKLPQRFCHRPIEFFPDGPWG
jgi:hypothetical protein